jgi:DNA helicase-2/ATP-dependent DNA helicase PcrA
MTAGSESLNPRQRAAVDHDAGPLIVLAGPGTGKTRVITHRVERLIRSGIDPAHVLAVTFTVKAAEEMRRRLAALIDGSAADAVHAHTFHGFAHRVVTRFADLAGVASEPLLIDSAQRRRIARDVARRDEVFAAHAAEGLDLLVNEGLEYIHAFQHAGRFPEQVLGFAAEWAGRLDRNDAGLDADSLAAERARHARFAAFARLYTAFHDECRRRGQLTFEDLILLTIRLLRDQPMVAAICRDEYRHVVVDEFQDVNAGQIELLHHLCPPNRNPDLCVVGDDDQSIYLFRGADDRAFEKFTRAWPGATTITLTESYRSQECILAAAAATISRASARFAPDKTVEHATTLRGTPPAPGAAVECVECEDDAGQFGQAVAAMIRTDRAATPDRPWASYAVIATTHLDLTRVAAALAAEDIPFHVARQAAATDDPGVRDVLAWVELIANPDADHAIQRLLVRPPFSIPADRVHGWMISYHAQRSRLRAGEPRPDATETFPGWLRVNHPDDPGVSRFERLHEKIHAACAGESADRALMAIIRLTDVPHADLPPGRERARRVARLADLLRFAQTRSRLLDEPGDLRAFWDYFRDLDEKEREELNGDEDERIDGADADSDAGDSVSLLTAHKAKGLEFDTVFVVRVAPQHGFGHVREERFEPPAGFEDRAGDTRSAKERRRAEQRRLFYVACTRAERRLVLLAKKKKTRSKGVEDYFQELVLDHPELVVRRGVKDIFDEAAAAGVRPAAAMPLLDGETPRSRLGRQESLDAARRAARSAAADALELMDRPGAGPADLQAATDTLRSAAARMALIASIDAGAPTPGWVAADPALGSFTAELIARLNRDRPAPATHPLTPPLQLSYTHVNDYLRCPRCYFIKHVLKFPESRQDAVSLGDAAHRALHAHFDRIRRAEAEGLRPPTTDDLLALGRAEYFRLLPPRARADTDHLAQLDAILRNAAERLHSAADEIVDLELNIRFPYEHNAVEHGFTAKLDRLDVWPAGGHRIIDYKTGRERDALANPEPDDLQLGVYALALRHHQGVPLSDRDAPALGVAEYWHLPTGRRGRIDLAAIDYGKTRRRIDAAVEGMLAGDFTPKPGCDGICRITDLGP